MSKPNSPDGPGRVSHVSGRVNWQKYYFDAAEVKDRLLRHIDDAAREFHIRIFAFVLMSNHFHLVAQSPEAQEYARLTSRRTGCRHQRAWPPGHQKSTVRAQFMKQFRSRTSRDCQGALGVEGRFWEGQYDARNVDSALSLAVRIAYDRRNPVKAKIVAAPEDYPWSSARTWLAGESCGIDITLEPLPFDADPAKLHQAILSYQGSSALDGVEGLGKLLKARVVGRSELMDLLRERGVPVIDCGTRAAEQRR